jgi:hypothetical protein
MNSNKKMVAKGYWERLIIKGLRKHLQRARRP